MTELTARLRIDTPIVQAPIGSASCPRLAAAVSNAGALGMLALSWRSVGAVVDSVRETRRLTDRPFGVNLVLAWPQAERLHACLDEGVGIVSTFWGNPAAYVDAVHAGGAVHVHTVGSAEDARAAADAGVDILVAQGVEAGGHVHGSTLLAELVPAVLHAVPGVPVIAAGGIATGAHASAAMRLGASGIWVGTRFLCSAEADVDDAYRSAIVAAGPGSTYHGTVFTKGWENAPHRVLRNSTVRRWLSAGSPPPGERPGEHDIVARGPDGGAIERYSDVIPARGTTGELEALALYAGMGAEHVVAVEPAERIVRELRDAL